jgi:hypothetical protein
MQVRDLYDADAEKKGWDDGRIHASRIGEGSCF